MSHFVFKIEGIPGGGRETTAYFVVPGRAGAQAIIASEDAEAVRRIAESYPGEALLFEPQLEEAARRAGYATDEITPERAHYIGLTAFDLALPGVLKDIRNPGLVYQFGRAAAEFFHASPHRRAAAGGAIELAYSGAFGGRRRAWLLGIDGGEPGIATYASPHDVAAVEQQAARGPEAAKEVDTLGMVFNQSMPFVNDAMSRAYGSPALPIPMKTERGRDVTVADEDLLLLGGALRAIAVLPDDETESNGYIRVGELELSVVAWRS